MTSQILGVFNAFITKWCTDASSTWKTKGPYSAPRLALKG